MKKTLFLLLALSSVSPATAEPSIGASNWTENGSFVVSYKWEAIPDGLLDFRVGYGNGQSDGGVSNYSSIA